MATNPYINKFYRKSEQGLYSDLMAEAIKFHGFDAYYLPRHLQREDLVFGEDPLAKFDEAFTIEFYLNNVQGFGGAQETITNFGLDLVDQISLWVHVGRWKEVFGKEFLRPREGDLIFFPFNGELMEISFVQPETVFYQLGSRPVYEITARTFVYSSEELATGIKDVDQVQRDFADSLLLSLGVGTGTFVLNEFVYQGSDLATASAAGKIAEIDNPTGTMKLIQIRGEFLTTAGDLIGDTSGATYALASLNQLLDVNDPLDDSVRFEEESDDILSFNETNPFGEPND